MKVPHEIVGRTRPTSQGLNYLQAAPVDVSGLARGLGNLGEGIDLAVRQAKVRDDQTDKFKALTDFSDFETSTEAKLNELKRQADPTGKGFAKSADDFYRQEEAKFLGTLPTAELRSEFKYRSAETRGRVFGQSLDFQYKAGDAFYRKSIDVEYQKGLKTLDPTVGGDPKNLEAARAKIFETIDASDLPTTGPDGTPGKEQLKRMVSIGLEGLAYKQEYKKNILGGAVNLDDKVGQVIDTAAARYGIDPQIMRTIAWIESKGDPQANNPGSSAGGLFQIIDSTAKQYGLKNKYDAAENADAGARITRDNIDGLTKAFGRAPSVGEIYLAHQQGLGGAVSLLSNPNSRATDIVGTDAVRLNGGAPGMSALEFANLWMHKAETANPQLDNNPAYSNVPYEDRIALRKDADQNIAQDNLLAANQLKARFAEQQNSLLNNIANGTQGQTDIEAAKQQDWGADFDFRKKAQDLYDKVNADLLLSTGYQNKLGTDGSVFDFTNADTKKQADAWFDQSKGADRLTAMDETYLANTLLPSAAKAHGLPPKAMGQLEAQTRSSNQEQALFAYKALAHYQDLDGKAFDSQTDDKLANDVYFYRSRRNDMPADQLMEYIHGGHTQEQRQRTQLLREEAQKNLATASSGVPALSSKVDEVVGSFGSMWSSSVHPLAIPAFARELNQDFQIAYIDAFVQQGDDAKATEQATAMVKRNWGVSEVGGQSTLMKYPIEQQGYPKLSGDYSWIDRQLRAQYGLTNGEEVQLLSDEQTEQEVRAFRKGGGDPPSYLVVAKGAEGDWKMLSNADGTPKHWWPTPSQTDLADDTRTFTVQQSAIAIENAQTKVREAQRLWQTGGPPVPQEFIDDVKRLQAEHEALLTYKRPSTSNDPALEATPAGAM